MRREVLDQDLARRELNVSDQDSARRAAAVYFYAVSSNVNLDPSDHEHLRANARPAASPTPGEGQLGMHQTEAESPKPQVVPVEPGLDTEAVMAAAETIIMSSAPPCEVGHEPVTSGALDLANPRIVDQGQSREKRVRSTGGQAKGSSSTKSTKPRETIVREEDSNYGSDSATETAEDENWAGILQKAVKAFKTRVQVQQDLEENARTIDRLTRRNQRKQCDIERLKGEINVLRAHSNKMERRYQDAETHLREANARMAELKSDIARLSNALPELTKDDQYFNTKFSGIFYSLESWVLQHFMRSKIDSSNLRSLPTELIQGLSSIWGEGWGALALEETLHTIEAVAIRIIQDMIFDTRILGILGEFFPEIEQHFGSCSVEVIRAWRIQTTQMIVGDKDFPSRLERRVCEVAEHIEKLLGPLGDGPPKRALARMRRLKTIVGQAAELALECSKEPATFRFHTYSPGWECQARYMTDANRTVDDEHLGTDEACVKFTVSPAVLRASENANDNPVVIMKARVVRHRKGPLGSEEECGKDDIESITAAQLDVAFGSSESQL